ncbi:DegT/DnrJ/EryC1/StrS family aminotransferase [Pseudobacteroides cellulosolvens]|uniref:Glutamine--scyllo-inositol transaminase n=1 Tax=Pseudobacteroides cellulosolvens ATCC 35603 = DSM 2933 TaxID=398512 RepID=A0A0L6JS37_9FIRM|nr:aminotransferase class I/II-fold pyridoxal phosphate-dependent enzyme [Pseudobacteroides cellulosolvens]KNY28613.1 Glutamine--scyllo-inositol transaminase [Pseudobacteroides cellulosolvens ATCC 35603 = DSM 2933]
MIPLSIPELSGKEINYIKECLDSGWVSSTGPYVKLFEERFKEYVGAKFAVAAINGTSALHLALKCAGIGEGDEVIVPSLTFAATVNAIKYLGAEPVFADVSKDTYVLDPNNIEELIGQKTKAILPVHLYGQPVEMDRILEIAGKFGLKVIEDAAQSLGSKYKGKYTGTIGNIGCFSFNGNKLITTGSGGMLVTDDEKIVEYALYLSTQAKDPNYKGLFYHSEVGYNYRMSNINAAMGLAQLEDIERRIQIKNRISGIYDKNLKDIDNIVLPVKKPYCETTFWLYPILVEEGYPLNKLRLMEKLFEFGVETRSFFMPLHLMKPYKHHKHGMMGITEHVSNHGINLPSSIGICEEDLIRICKVLGTV